MSDPDRQAAAFYCVADARYFLGAVALVNSLRLHGHDEPIYLLDAGLEPAQRELLAAEVTLVDPPAGPEAVPPHLQKAIAPLRHPAEVMVLIDADMIATRSLAGLIEEAASGASGRVVAFANDRDRHVPEWGELLELGPQRRGTYVSVGLVALGGELGAEVLRLLDDRQRRVDPARTFQAAEDPSYPFHYPEQDVLNAILATRVPPEGLVAHEHRLAPTPPYTGVRLISEGELRCSYADGAEPYVLHQFVRKPWLERMYHGIYPRLFARLLLGPDVVIRVDESDVPRRMRSGGLARLERMLVNVGDLGRWYLAERPSRWIGERVGRLRQGARGGE